MRTSGLPLAMCSNGKRGNEIHRPTRAVAAVDVEETKGQGTVTGLTTRSHAGRHRMLILHEDTGVTIWDLRHDVVA